MKMKIDGDEFVRKTVLELVEMQRDVLITRCDELGTQASDLDGDMLAMLGACRSARKDWVFLMVSIAYARDDLSDFLWSEDWDKERLVKALSELSTNVPRFFPFGDRKLTPDKITRDFVDYCKKAQ